MHSRVLTKCRCHRNLKAFPAKHANPKIYYFQKVQRTLEFQHTFEVFRDRQIRTTPPPLRFDVLDFGSLGDKHIKIQILPTASSIKPHITRGKQKRLEITFCLNQSRNRVRKETKAFEQIAQRRSICLRHLCSTLANPSSGRGPWNPESKLKAMP